MLIALAASHSDLEIARYLAMWTRGMPLGSAHTLPGDAHQICTIWGCE